MDTLSYKTVNANSATVKKEWLVVDATDQVLGRLASKVAKILRGKNKPEFTPHVDCGDNVIIINAEKICLTGNKMSQKTYISHSGYPGGQKEQTVADVLDKYPERVVEKAVKGMLPKNRLGRSIFQNLKVYTGPEHQQAAQKPRVINLDDIR